MGKTYKATVVVAPREGGHAGWWQGGKFWAANQQYEDVELSEEEVQGLARRPGVVVLVGGKAVKPTERTGPATTPTELTADEIAAVEAYRRQRAQMATAQQEASSPEGGLEFEKKKDAMERAMAPGATPGATTAGTGVAAAQPLMDADILAGKPPPENQSMTGSPIQQGKKR